jgi:hypothetical protein
VYTNTVSQFEAGRYGAYHDICHNLQAFLKEVMVDLCNYNKRGPNQGKYELKPEYRSKPTDENPGTT